MEGHDYLGRDNDLVNQEDSYSNQEGEALPIKNQVYQFGADDQTRNIPLSVKGMSRETGKTVGVANATPHIFSGQDGQAPNQV